MSPQVEQASPRMHETQISAMSAQPAEQKGARLLYIDNVRVVLTIQVIVFHLAITYGAIGSWYYHEPTQDVATTLLLSIFVAASQAFFMGFFFLISAYLTPGTYERKGAVVFLKDRLVRLGIPLLVYDLLINPFVIFVATGMRQPYWQLLGDYLLHFSGIGNGPLWFVEALLIFASLYVLWRWLTRHRVRARIAANTPPTHRAIVLLVLGLAVTNFVVRIWLPIGWDFQPLNFQFPFFAQYCALFVIGIIAYRRNWFLGLSDAMGKMWLRIALVSLVWLPVIGALTIVDGGPQLFLGGLHWQAFVYALWEAVFCLGMCIGLLVFFRRRFNHQGKVGKVLSANAYTAYIIHAPVIVCLAYALGEIHLYPLLKFALVALVAVPLVFLLSHSIRKLPFAHKIL